MNQNLKVMSVFDLSPRKLGSFEEYTIILSRYLTQRGGQSVLVFNQFPPDELRPHFVDAGGILETKPFKPFGWESASALNALLSKHRPDIVHFHFVNLLSLDVLAASLRRGIKVVYSDHTSDIQKQRTPLRSSLLRASKRIFSSQIQKVITPSNYVHYRNAEEGINAKKIATVYNGVNAESFRNAPVGQDIRAKYRIEPNDFIVASISQLIPEKGIGYLIEAAAIARKGGRNISFIHAGDGPRAAEYRERVHQLGIDKHFIFAGLLNSWDIASILQQSDVFALPCTWGEAFSLVILEAMMAGKPLIVTAVGGNVEAVEDGRNGLVVPPHDAHALAEAILALQDSPERRREMGTESVRRSGDFTVQRWVSETIAIYEQI